MKEDIGALVFVTTELYPFSAGGIGRFTYNKLKTLSPHDLARSVVLLTHGSVSRSAFELLFPGVELWQISEVKEVSNTSDIFGCSEDPWFAMSCRVLKLLLQESKRRPISYVEFPDWGGLGFATTQEKLARGFLFDATIAVRVHSTEAILVLRETRNLQPQDLRQYDLERKTYRDCDLVVAHLRPVAEETRRCFGFSEDEWWPRVLITPAPVDIGDRSPCARSIQPDLHTPIVFTSKFQEIKNPVAFMQAAIGVLLDNADYRGKVVLACGGLSLDYAKSIISQVNADLLPRIEKLDGRRTADRDDIISRGIVVFPAAFESFCLAAYEASLLGAVVVLNEVNPAFGEDTPWVDGENCLKFDGSTIGLQRALERALSLKTPLRSVSSGPVVLPWDKEADVRNSLEVSGGPPLLSVVIVNQNDGALLPDTLESVMAQDYPDLEIIVVDDGSNDSFSRIMRRQLEAGNGSRVKLVSISASVGRAAALNHGVSLATGDYVVRMHSGDLLRSGFFECGVSALERQSEFNVYCSQVAYYQDADVTSDKDVRFESVVGEAFVAGSHFNYFAKGAWIARRDLFKKVPFRANLGTLSDWGWMLDVVAQGSKVICSPRTEVLLRDRSLVDAAEPIGQPHILDHLVVSNSPFPRPSFPVSNLALVCGGGSYRVVQRDWPDWYVHMMDNGYEPEMSFVGGVLGHTRLGRVIRTNSSVSSFLERFLRWATRLPPGVS